MHLLTQREWFSFRELVWDTEACGHLDDWLINPTPISKLYEAKNKNKQQGMRCTFFLSRTQ